MKKKKLSLKFIEEHTLSWAFSRLAEIKETVEDLFADRKFSLEEKDTICCAHVKWVMDVVDLLTPFEQEDNELIEWADNFVIEYSSFCSDDDMVYK